MKIIIQKFGGTSVSTKDKREMVVSKVKKAISDGYFPVLYQLWEDVERVMQLIHCCHL